MSRPANLPARHADVDARAFLYEMEPVVRRQQWILEAADAAHAQAQARSQAASARLAATAREISAMTAYASQTSGGRIDLQARRLAIQCLTQLERRRQDEARVAQEMKDAVDAARQACVDAQLRLEGFERHREEAFDAFAAEARRRQAGEQDRDWLARQAARSRMSGGQG
ncbi:MAG: hypothetical protein REJ50_14120 [Bordetella sp.]|nr:hypothetical protein [Bordetella sp.]